MHTDFSVAPITTAYPALQALAGSSGVSREAEEVRRAAKKVVNEAESSQALFAGKAGLLSDLAALQSECAEDGWDGNDAAAIDYLAILQVQRLMRALPDRCPLPEVAVEPDGSISLDWIRSRNRLFSLSVSSSDRIAFAWIDGAESGHGVARFDGQSVPPRILQGIEAAVGTGYVTLRAT
jgi:hypothetical protein